MTYFVYLNGKKISFDICSQLSSPQCLTKVDMRFSVTYKTVCMTYS